MMIRAFLTTALLITPLMLSACGMRPVYGTYAANPAARADIAATSINNIPDRIGQNLRNKLIDTMYQNGYPAGNAKYHLNVVNLRENTRQLSIEKDSTNTRTQIQLTAHITLTNASGETLLIRNVQAYASYNNLPSEYTTYVTADSVRDSATMDLANQITTALELYFSNPAGYANDPDTAPISIQENLIDTRPASPLQ